MAKIVESERKFIEIAVEQDYRLEISNFEAFLIYLPSSKEFLQDIIKVKKGVKQYMWISGSPETAKKFTRLKLAEKEANKTPKAIVVILFKPSDYVVVPMNQMSLFESK